MSRPASGSRWKFTTATYVIVVGAWLLYAALTLLAPAVTNLRFHMSEPALLLLRLTIIIPVHLIWLMAARGATAFKAYAAIIKGGAESRAISLISTGLLWTLAYLVVTSIIGAIVPFFWQTPGYNVLVIIRDHLSAIASLIAFATIYRGSHLLRSVAHFETWTRSSSWAIAGFGLFAFLFVLQFSTNPVLDGQAYGRTATSIMPHSILLFTMIVPYLAAWFMGLTALINIGKYALYVKGVLYRQALRDLVRGIGAVLAFSILAQCLTFAAKFFATLKLGPLLLAVYLLLLSYGLGFLLIRSGARKLARLEAVQ